MNHSAGKQSGCGLI